MSVSKTSSRGAGLPSGEVVPLAEPDRLFQADRVERELPPGENLVGLRENRADLRRLKERLQAGRHVLLLGELRFCQQLGRAFFVDDACQLALELPVRRLLQTRQLPVVLGDPARLGLGRAVLPAAVDADQRQ